MFANIKSYDSKDRHLFKDWIDEINQACWVSEHDFRTEIIKKLTGAVRQVVMSCRNLSDDALLAKLRSSFSDAPTMNEAREELRNMRQKEHKIHHCLHLQMGMCTAKIFRHPPGR